ncbi:MAG: GAF domain-containing protein [Candidatus Gastranaerophilales bacterium]|nr:GAF domain-containing protein [Candidatus Gastranaerophilales bacterium]
MLKNKSIEADKETLEKADSLLHKTFELFEKENFQEAFTSISQAHSLFLKIQSIGNVSICLSFIAMLKYFLEPQNYYKSLLILEDAKFLAQSSGFEPASGVNRFAFSQVTEKEGNYQEAILYLSRADKMLADYPYLQTRVYESLAFLNLKLKNFESTYSSLNKAFKMARVNNYFNCLERLSIIAGSLQEQNDEILNKAIETLEVEPEHSSQDPMVAMLKIARTISAEIDLDTLLTTIAEQTKLALNADRCTVFLIDKETCELWSRVALGMDRQEIRFPMDKGLAGHVAMTGETIHIKNAYTDARFNKDIDVQTGYTTKNILCMPIRNIKYEIIGVFQVLNKYNGDFTDHDEDLLLTIGSSAGIALENNILFNHQQQMLKEQKMLFNSFIDALSASIDARDKITSGHSSRVKMYSEIISRQMKLDESKIELISQAAVLHDIGKIGIKDSVLQKEGRLTEEEYKHIQSHVNITHDILSKMSVSKGFDEVVEVAASHHEKFDGTGYFRHLSGENIPLGGRILAVSDVFDAITSVRHYRDKMPIKNAINILVEGMNKHFDKHIVDAFLDISCDKIIDIFLTEYHGNLKHIDREVLHQYTMRDLYELLCSENQTDREKEFIALFESYYTNKSVIKK